MMKENKKEMKLPIDDVKSRIWKMLDSLRTEPGIKSSDGYNVILFLLSAFKDGLISIDLLNENSYLKGRLIERLHNLSYELHKEYNPILYHFEPAIQSLTENGIRNLFHFFSDINKQVLIENFPSLFDDILYRIAQSEGKHGGGFIQPVEITRFMCGLAEMKTGAKVYNPFAGIASFGVYLDEGHDYFGQELDQKTWALGALRLMAYRRLGISRYVGDDSILHWPAESEKFDLIVANPPFGMRLGQKDRIFDRDYRTIEQFLIEKGVKSLKQNGKLIALITQGFLFRGMQEQRLREQLVEEDLVETVISLPGGLLLNTGIPLVILVLNKGKKIAGKVKFVDAKNFVLAKSPRDKVLRDKDLLSFIQGDHEETYFEAGIQVNNMLREAPTGYNSGSKKAGNNNPIDIERVVDLSEIRKNEYNLNVARYFQKPIEGVKLGDILELVRGQRVSLPETGKLIRIRDLKDDKIDFTLDVSTVEDAELQRSGIQLVSESCLLLALRWRTLKPTLFEFKGEPIFRSQDILSFKVNEAIADKAYLINELHADYVQEQLEAYRLGASVIPFIRKEDLMEVVIKLPSLQEQRAKIQGVYELSDKIKSLQEEHNALAHGKTIMQFNEFASLKHTLGRPRQNILDWSDNLLDFLTKNKEDLEALNKSFSEFYDIDILSALKEIKRDVNFITDVLEKGENGLVLSEYKKQVIPLSDINSIINELSNNGFKFKIRKLLLKGEKLKERGIYANKTLFKTLLDNILTNANKYAFDKKATGNEVVIDLTEVDDSLAMEIRNNGKPFPKNFDREKFIAKYSTADSSNGSGLGGYDVHRIATDFNNPDWILSLNEDPFFLV